MNEDERIGVTAGYIRIMKYPSGICRSLQNRGYYRYCTLRQYSMSQFTVRASVYYSSFSDTKVARYSI